MLHRQNRLASWEAINLGFPEGDQYNHAECEHNLMAADLAERLELRAEAGHTYHPPSWVIQLLWDQVDKAIADIPVALIPCTGEPYENSEAMQKDVRDNNRMYLRVRKTSAIAGHKTMLWRAAHDYYGHVLTKAPFTLSGELRAYIAHQKAFPKDLHPFIWNNVVLENAFRLNRGEFYCRQVQCGSTFVFDEIEFGPEQLYHRQAA